jgi:energy-coupling factor transporter ATP-binding protein EcfA2
MHGGEVLVITGPPGAGKSTVARALAARLDHAVLVRGDDVLACVVSGFVEPWLPEADGQNRASLAATAATAREYAIGGYAVIVDAVLGPWHLDAFLTTLGLPCGYLVLRPDRSTTIDRAAGRCAESLTDVETVEFMWEQFADLGVHETHVIDTSALDVDAAVDAVLATAPKSPLGATPD